MFQVQPIEYYKAQYPHGRPQPAWILYAMIVVNVLGMIGLFITTDSAYQLVAGAWQSFFLAVLIEAAIVVEAWLAMSRAGSKWAWAALVVTVPLSGFFAYAQFSNSVLVTGAAVGPLLLLAFSVGPVSAIFTMSLALGKALRDYQDKVDTWESSRAEWAQEQRQEAIKKAEREARKAQRAQAKAQETQPAESPHNAGHNATQPAEPGHNAGIVSHNGHGLEPIPGMGRLSDQDERLANLYELTKGRVFGWADIKSHDGHDLTVDIFNKLVVYGQQVGSMTKKGRGRYQVEPSILEWVDSQEVF